MDYIDPNGISVSATQNNFGVPVTLSAGVTVQPGDWFVQRADGTVLIETTEAMKAYGLAVSKPKAVTSGLVVTGLGAAAKPEV